MSSRRPQYAGPVGDIFCEVNQAFAEILGFAGGNKPGKEFTVDRCDLPGDAVNNPAAEG
jgi:hypothetical protein